MSKKLCRLTTTTNKATHLTSITTIITTTTTITIIIFTLYLRKNFGIPVISKNEKKLSTDYNNNNNKNNNNTNNINNNNNNNYNNIHLVFTKKFWHSRDVKDGEYAAYA
jgi:hypothetical protein